MKTHIKHINVAQYQNQGISYALSVHRARIKREALPRCVDKDMKKCLK